MLVFSRKASESFTIGGDVTVTILAIQSGRVKLGINAPRHIPIQRDDAIQDKKGDTEEPPGNWDHLV